VRTANRPVRLLARLVLLLLSLGGALALALQVAAWPDHPLADMTQVTRWARNIQSEGIEPAYSGAYPETYLIYPPGMAYVYRAAVAVSERVAPPAWLGGADWLRYSVKLMPVAGHIALALTLFGVCAAAGGFWRGWIAATLYAWNPAALFDAAYWGQGDSINTTFLLLAIGALVLFPSWWPLRRDGRWRWQAQLIALAAGAAAGAFLAAGSLIKPQTWIFLPLLLWVAFRRTGPLGLGVLGGVAAATALRLVQPWIAAGRREEMLSAFGALTQVMPSVSANAHNLWWLKLPGVAISVLDWQPVGGFGEWAAPPLLTHATAGRLGFGLLVLLPLLRLTGPLSPRLVLAGAAYTASAYFMTITQVHENHQFAALPLLAATAALDPWFALPFLVTTVCSFLNMAVHDFLIGDTLAAALTQHLPWKTPLEVQTANAALNVAGFALFTLLLLRRPPVAAQSARALLWRARLVLVAGVLVAGGALGVLLAILRTPELAARLWERTAASALGAAPVEVHLGLETPPEALLARGAVDFANLLYTLGGVAAITGTVAAVAGAWWLGCAAFTRWRLRDRPPLAPPLAQPPPRPAPVVATAGHDLDPLREPAPGEALPIRRYDRER
jgi:hypothetical protein